MTETPMPPRDALVVGAALAFTAGFADASTFVGADGIFCAHVTGNFVVLASDLALHARREEWLKLATFPIFVAAVMATTWLTGRSRAPLGGATVRRLLLLKVALLAVAAAVGVVQGAAGPGPSRAAIVALLVVAMAIQNALHRLRPSLGAMTTVMTGNVTTWLTGLLGTRDPAEAPKRRALGAVILLFAAGCVAGAYGVATLGFGALGAPVVALLIARSRIGTSGSRAMP